MSEVIERYIPDTGRPVTDHEREILQIAAEEANEVAIAISKILRFGVANVNPTTGVSNIRELGLELGDFDQMVLCLDKLGLIDWKAKQEGRDRKYQRLKKYLQTEAPK